MISYKQIASRAEEIDALNEDLDGTGILEEDIEKDMNGQDDQDSGCNCENSCDCLDPSGTPASSDSDSDLIVLSSTEEDFAAGPHQTSILFLVKTEPTEQSTKVDNQV